MFGNRNFERVRQMFADQFEPYGDDYLYRKSLKSAPIQVSAGERARYVETFNKAIKYSSWGLLGSVLILGFAYAGYATATNTKVSDIVIDIGLGAIMALFFTVYYWAWSLPARELRGRGAVGEARSREEIEQRFFAKLTYGQLAAGAGGAIFIVFSAYRREGSLTGWNLIWLVTAGSLIVLIAVQAFRKWRFDRVGRG